MQVKTWFQNRRMKHKKQLRKTQDDQKSSGDVDRGAESSCEGEMNEKCPDDMKSGTSPEDTYILDEHEDDVDIEDDMCSPEHLL